MRRGLWLVLVFAATTLMAQSPAMQPFEINMERVKFASFGGNFGTTTTYLVPTVNLQISVAGAVWAKAGRSKAHARYYVDGVTREMLQGLAKNLQDDLVTRLRGAGYSVLTYEDVKTAPEVASLARNTINTEYGVPTTGGFDLPGGFGKPVKFALVSPSDEQSFDSPTQGPAWPFRGMAKAQNLTVIVPELTFTTPQMFSESSSTAFKDTAGVSADPSMVFEGAKIAGVNPKGGQPSVAIQRHGQRKASEVTGTIALASEDNLHVNHVISTTRADYVMTLNQTAFVDGVLRVGYALNDMLVKEIVKQHR